MALASTEEVVVEPNSVLLIDLDETLIPDRAATRKALAQTFHSLQLPGGQRPINDFLLLTRELWRDYPGRQSVDALGVSSWEALWTDAAFTDMGTTPTKASFPASVWTAYGERIGRKVDGAQAAEAYVKARTGEIAAYSGVVDSLTGLSESHTLWLATDGSSPLQRLKLARSGLQNFFERVLISAEVGALKSDEGFAGRVSQELTPGQQVAYVVGDNPMTDGVLAAHGNWPFAHLTIDPAVCPDCAPGTTHIRELSGLMRP